MRFCMIVVILLSSVTPAHALDPSWLSYEKNEIASGCSEGALSRRIGMRALEPTDLRFSREPVGPTLDFPDISIRFANHVVTKILSEDEEVHSELIIGVGTDSFSCISVSRIDACPQADNVYRSMIGLPIDATFMLETPFTAISENNTVYNFQSIDGSGATMLWRSGFTDESPHTMRIEAALSQLSSCIEDIESDLKEFSEKE